LPPAPTIRTVAGTLLEVKSSFVDTKETRDLVDDLSYTTTGFERAGLSVSRASLVLLSRGYRFGDNAVSLLEALDRTGDVQSRLAGWAATAEATAAAVFSDTPPTPVLSSACRDCAAFDVCLGKGLAHTVLGLPSLHHTKLKRFSADGTIDLAAVPDGGLNANQLRAKQSAVSNQLVVDAHIRERLAEVAWPCRYLDFETVATVLPLNPDRGSITTRSNASGLLVDTRRRLGGRFPLLSRSMYTARSAFDSASLRSGSRIRAAREMPERGTRRRAP
jgi:hypothetical protein